MNSRSKYEKRSFYSKNIILIFLGLVLVSFASFAYYQQSKIHLLDDKIRSLSKKIEISPSPSPTPTPTATSMPKPTFLPTSILSPNPSPTPNTAIQDRINQIDQQIQNLKNQQQGLLDVMKSGVNCTTPLCQSIFYSDSTLFYSLNNQIKQLQNEKADLQLQLTK